MAEIPEPSNLIFGKINVGESTVSPGDVALTVTAKLGGTVLANYQFGSKAELGDNYLLSIPLDSEGSRAVGTAREGDQIEIFVSNVFAKNVTIGSRGSLLPTDLSINLSTYQNQDSDNDGIPDYIELQHAFLDENNPNDAGADEDNDGYSNLEEVLAQTDLQDDGSQPFLTDYTTSVVMNTEAGGEMGIMIRYQGPDNYYRFSWNSESDTRRLEKNVDGTITVLASNNAVLTPLTNYTVEFSVLGNQISVHVDGVELFNLLDDSLIRGPLALYNRNASKTQYDNLSLTDLVTDRETHEHFSDDTVLDFLTVVNEGGVGTVPTWSIENKILIQDTQIFNGSPQTEGRHGTFAVFLLNDTDADGVPNESDAFPSDPNATLDSDNDGMPDAWEVDHGFDPQVNDADGDEDGDTISNLDEYKNNTDPNTYNPNNSAPETFATTTWNARQISSISMVEGNNFATTSAIDPNVKIWDANSALDSAIATYDTQAVNGVHSSATYLNEVIVGTGDATVQVWDTSSNQKKLEFTAMNGSALAVDVNDSYYTAGTSEGLIYLWDKSGELLNKWNTGSLFISDIKFYDGLVYVSTSLPKETTAWDVSGNLHYRVEGDEGEGFPKLDISAKGSLLIAGGQSRKGITRMQSAPSTMGSKAVSEVLTVFDNPLSGLYINESTQQMITGDEEGNIYITQLPSGQLFRVFKAHDLAVTDATLTDTAIISASIDGEIKVWNLD